jgi:septal ring factor EnvC (AmiA/AmiB activator)
MEYQNKIDEVITQVLTEKTFNLEIIEKIKLLKDDFENAKQQITRLAEINSGLYKELDEHKEKCRTLDEEVQEFRKKSAEIDKKERMLEKNQYEIYFQTKRADEIKELFTIVFRNPVVQKSTFESVPLSSNGYVTTHTSNSTQTETIN